MSKKKKKAEVTTENPEWKPIISSLMSGEVPEARKGSRLRAAASSKGGLFKSGMVGSMLDRMSDKLGG